MNLNAQITQMSRGKTKKKATKKKTNRLGLTHQTR
jgi:hypothetical protein